MRWDKKQVKGQPTVSGVLSVFCSVNFLLFIFSAVSHHPFFSLGRVFHQKLAQIFPLILPSPSVTFALIRSSNCARSFSLAALWASPLVFICLFFNPQSLPDLHWHQRWVQMSALHNPAPLNARGLMFTHICHGDKSQGSVKLSVISFNWSLTGAARLCNIYLLNKTGLQGEFGNIF